MKFPAPSRRAHKQFCEIEGWDIVRNATGKRGHHLTFELALQDGSILRTRVSRPADKTSYGKALWAHILTDQICVSESEFWACVTDNLPPERSGSDAVAVEAPPVGVVYQLIHRAGLPTDEVAAMSRQDAIDRLNQFNTYGT